MRSPCRTVFPARLSARIAFPIPALRCDGSGQILRRCISPLLLAVRIAVSDQCGVSLGLTMPSSRSPHQVPQRKSPGRGDRGFKDGRGGGVGGCLPSNLRNPSFFMLTAALSLASPLRLDATDRRAPLAARRRDQPPRTAPLQSALLSGHGQLILMTGERRAGKDQREATISVRNVRDHAINHRVSARDERLLVQAHTRIIEYPTPGSRARRRR